MSRTTRRTNCVYEPPYGVKKWKFYGDAGRSWNMPGSLVKEGCRSKNRAKERKLVYDFMSAVDVNDVSDTTPRYKDGYDLWECD